MAKHIRKFVIASLLVISVLNIVGCGALAEPERDPLPTPVATARPFDASLTPIPDLVTDPVSDVVPKIDSTVQMLVDQVSQQQLMGYIQTLESFGTRNSFSDVESENFGIGAARQWLHDEFIRVGNGRLQVDFQDFPLYYDGLYAEQRNVVAVLPGRAENAGVVVIMAHYDNRPSGMTDGESKATGANDNGSGIALLLETARLLSSHEWDQTVIFLATAAEEQGTFGARHFAQDAFLNSMNILATINYDAVGGRKDIPRSVRLFAPNLNFSQSGQLARYYEYVGGMYVPDFGVNVIDALDREGRWGDHREFVNIGIPAVRLTESIEEADYVNSLQDTWDKIDYDYLQKVVQLNVAVAANIAGAPAQPQAPVVQTTEALGTYQLSWPVDASSAGYAISFRPIDIPSHGAFHLVKTNQAGNVALTGMDPSVNYSVSVAALDENGRLSYFSPEMIVGPDALALNP
ncbi:MAG: M20/M25/M40 family metallo-hydrolase [Anaerolineae bacterium]|nr:M20/M25/M40 family metallo-hydrolase [Anaerolineae bacterium]